MKKLARIYSWIIVSVVIQVIILSYLNFIYLPNRGTIKATMYQFGDDSIADRNMRLPSGAEKITVSFSGLFAAYLKDGRLIIADIQKGREIKTLEPSDGEEFTYFRWLPDRDMLIYSVKSSGKGTGQVGISTYEIATSLDRSYPRIKGLPEGSAITDIELSALTNVVYVLIKTSDTRTRLYKYNIMDNLSFVMKAGAEMLIKETAYSDSLFYQDGNGNIMKRNGKSGKVSKALPKGKYRLLAVDSEDRAYVGNLDSNGLITDITYRKFEQSAEEWQKIALKSPVSVEDIFITQDGSVYTADRSSGKILKPDGVSAGAFRGDLLELLDDYIVSLDGSRLELKAIEK